MVLERRAFSIQDQPQPKSIIDGPKLSSAKKHLKRSLMIMQISNKNNLLVLAFHQRSVQSSLTNYVEMQESYLAQFLMLDVETDMLASIWKSWVSSKFKV